MKFSLFCAQPEESEYILVIIEQRPAFSSREKYTNYCEFVIDFPKGHLSKERNKNKI